MWRIITVTVFLAVICKNSCQLDQEPPPKETDPKINLNKTVTINLNSTVKTVNVSALVEKEIPKNKTTEVIVVQPDIRALNEPALHRLFYVLLGLSTVTVCYVALKMYRVRKGVARPTHVRKYGVLTQRSDIEMEPLHMDDDEDDDTVFDVGVHANR